MSLSNKEHLSSYKNTSVEFDSLNDLQQYYNNNQSLFNNVNYVICTNKNTGKINLILPKGTGVLNASDTINNVNFEALKSEQTKHFNSISDRQVALVQNLHNIYYNSKLYSTVFGPESQQISYMFPDVQNINSNVDSNKVKYKMTNGTITYDKISKNEVYDIRKIDNNYTSYSITRIYLD